MGTQPARWVPREISFLERPWVQESGVGVVLTMVDEGFDPGEGEERVKGQSVNLW